MAGWPTSHGSKGASKEPVAESELVVQRFEEAGFVLFNKTATPEFGAVSFTEATPWAHLEPVEHRPHPGGLSGGASRRGRSGSPDRPRATAAGPSASRRRAAAWSASPEPQPGAERP